MYIGNCNSLMFKSISLDEMITLLLTYTFKYAFLNSIKISNTCLFKHVIYIYDKLGMIVIGLLLSSSIFKMNPLIQLDVLCIFYNSFRVTPYGEYSVLSNPVGWIITD